MAAKVPWASPDFEVDAILPGQQYGSAAAADGPGVITQTPGTPVNKITLVAPWPANENQDTAWDYGDGTVGSTKTKTSIHTFPPTPPATYTVKATNGKRTESVAVSIA